MHPQHPQETSGHYKEEQLAKVSERKRREVGGSHGRVLLPPYTKPMSSLSSSVSYGFWGCSVPLMNRAQVSLRLYYTWACIRMTLLEQRLTLDLWEQRLLGHTSSFCCSRAGVGQRICISNSFWLIQIRFYIFSRIVYIIISRISRPVYLQLY